jgi:hypothetical protein
VTYQAVVIPADVTKPVHVVEYEQQSDLLHLLYREIGCDHVDATPQLSSRFGQFVLWLDDVGLLRRPIEHNDRATALCRATGYDVPDLAGTAVVTGGANAAGDTRTVPPELRDRLLRGFGTRRVKPTNDERRIGPRREAGRERRDSAHRTPRHRPGSGASSSSEAGPTPG